MKHIIFNNIKLSKLCLGTVQFGLNYGIANNVGKPTQNVINNILKYVLSEKINCFDTAVSYGNSEKSLGIFFKDYKKEINVISKLSTDSFNEDIHSCLNESLHNLNVSSLYALLLHDTKLLNTWTISSSKLINNLMDNNKIKHFGVSIYTDEQFNLALNNEKVNIIQIPFNIFDQRAINLKWLEKAKKKNKLIFIRSIYLQGLLLMEENDIPEKLYKLKKYIFKLDNVCKEFNISRNELALNFVDSVASDSIILFGCEKLEQAKENIKLYNSLKIFDKNRINRLVKDFSGIEQNLYDPRNW